MDSKVGKNKIQVILMVCKVLCNSACYAFRFRNGVWSLLNKLRELDSILACHNCRFSSSLTEFQNECSVQKRTLPR